MGSTGSISAFAFLVLLSVLYLNGELTDQSYGEVYNTYFKSIFQPLLVAAFLINHIILGIRFRTGAPLLGFFIGIPVALFIVAISFEIGVYATYLITYQGIQQFTVIIMVQLALVGALAIRGLRDIIKLHKNPNQRLEPIVKTPIDEVEAQSTQAHP